MAKPVSTAVRTGRQIILSCSVCGSSGTSPAIRTKKVVSPAQAAEIDAYKKQIEEITRQHTASVALIEAQNKGPAAAAAKRAQLLALAKETNDKLMAVAATDPSRGLPEMVENCPWCNAPINVDVKPEPKTF